MPGSRAAHSEQRYSETIFMCKAEHNIFLLGKDLIFLERLPLIHSRMDRSSRQRSGASSTGSTASVQPVVHHVRSGSVGFSSAKRTQNYAAKAAAQRLAQVMASQSNEDDEEDDSPFRYGSSCGTNTNSRASAHSRSTRSQSPALGRNLNGHTSSTRSTSTGRPSIAAQPLSKVLPSGATLKQRSSKPPLDPVADMRREKRFSADLNFQGEADNRREAASLHDEIDLLREENENLLNKLRLAEQKWQEAEAKARELEKQVASLGEGLSLEARLLNRKEAALRQREVAFRVEKQTKDVQDEEIAALRLEAKTARDEAAAAVEQVQVAEVEAKALRSMMQRMILTQEEMEEVVLKRCWLARYWGLAVRHGIHAEIASQKHEYWSSLAPLPLEVVMSAGQKSKEESTIYNVPVENGGNEELDKRSRFIRELNDLSGEGNIESMLAVEKGLRELASLKVEDAIVLVMAEQRRLSLIRASHSFQELSEEEIEDVQFKQAWLIYFWRIAGNHGVEKDIVDDRFQYWVGRSNQSPTFHDVIDVERGLTELRKLGIEDQLWESSRKEIAPEFPHWKIGADIKAETAAL